MQVLYSLNQNKGINLQNVERILLNSVEQSYNSYLLNVLTLQKIAFFANKYVDIRNKKFLPTENDKLFKPKLANNSLVESLRNNKGFVKLLEERKLSKYIDADMVKSIYIEFTKEQEYIDYFKKEFHQLDDHTNILLVLYRFCTNNEFFTAFMDDLFINWVDDKSLVVGSVKKTIKSLPARDAFYEEYVPDAFTVEEFGIELLYKTTHLEEELLELIKPNLKNWDIDRVAILDLILMKMALCEFLYFPTIPLKVTMNEYIDLSKNYSTPKSKDFVNGILDKLSKILQDEGKINKEGRGLK